MLEDEYNIGLSFRHRAGVGIVVSSSPVSPSLKESMKVLSINNIDIGALTLHGVATTISGTEGEVKIVAVDPDHFQPEDPNEFVVTKAKESSRVGLKFKEVEDVGIVVSAVLPTGLFASTALTAGMKVVAINGMDIVSLQEIAMIVGSTVGRVAITARATQEAKEFTIKATTATAVKFKHVEGVGMIVSEVPNKDSSGLEVGMKIESINGIAVDVQDATTLLEASAIIHTAKDNVTLVAVDLSFLDSPALPFWALPCMICGTEMELCM